MKLRLKNSPMWAGLLLGSAAVVASANSLVTFQVDMTQAVANFTFDPATQTVAARGSFNGWTAFALTNNPNGVNTNLWTGTTNIAANGTVMQYKYAIEPGPTYEGVFLGGNHNRLITLPSASGASITLPAVYFGDNPPAPLTVSVTFQVNMAQQINTGAFIPLTSTVQARGGFNGWGGSAVAQTNDPSIHTTNQFGLVSSNVYVGTYDLTGSPGQTMDYKYYIDTGANWEAPPAGTGDPQDNNNRFFNLGAGATQKLPIVFFNDAPYSPVATNAVSFQVDMSAQILGGFFTPGGTVEVRGDFNSWGTPQILLTNDLGAANTNLYSAVVPITDGVGATRQYKFWSTVAANGGWETMADNRSFKIVSGTAQTVGPFFFNNLNPNDLLPADTVVTFSVNMTNAVGTDSHVFDPSQGDQLFINGLPNGFTSWSAFALPQLTNYPVGSSNYSVEVTLPKGSPVVQTYKYGINAVDDEAPANNNHVRVVRSIGTYTMALDTFGNQYVEPSFGQLSVGRPSGGRVPVSWLGRPAVHLQTRTNLAVGTWQNLLETDGATWLNGHTSTNGFVSVTNFPAGAPRTFMRLIKQ